MYVINFFVNEVMPKNVTVSGEYWLELKILCQGMGPLCILLIFVNNYIVLLLISFFNYQRLLSPNLVDGKKKSQWSWEVQLISCWWDWLTLFIY